jgi:CRISPR-associated protein Cas1
MTFYETIIIGSLVYHYNKSGRLAAKTAVKTMLMPVMLFGSKDKTFRDKWITDTANQCIRNLDKFRQAKSAKEKNPEKAADLAVKKQKNRYRKLENINRELVVESFGVFVGKNQKNVVVKKRGVKQLDFPLHKLETINIISRGITISSDLILYCSKNKIPIFFSDTFGAPLCALQNPVYGDMDLGLLQLQFLQNGHEALELAKKIIEGKVKNQINLLKYYSRHRPPYTVYGSAAAEEIPAMKKAVRKIKKISLENNRYQDARQRIMGCEAVAAGIYWKMTGIYWKMIRLLLNDDAPDFTGRKHQGARDLVNSLLNYGYGFLYRQVWREVIMAGLNPKISFLHTPQGEKPVLVYDLVEEFRPQAVDRVVFSMLTKNEKLAINKTNGLINNASRKKIIESLLEKQGAAVIYHGEKTLLKNVIKNQVSNLCRHLKGEKNYRPFIGYY